MNRFMSCLTIALFCLLPQVAAAGALKNASQDFAKSSAVSDSELGEQRGGFLNVNGVLVDFGFMSRVEINGVLVNEYNVNTQDLLNAMASNSQTFLLQPNIIQNVDNDKLIAIQEQINLAISGAGAAASAQAIGNIAAFQNTMSIH